MTGKDTRRWLGWLALVILFAVACGFLSNWQFNRRQDAISAMSQLDVNYVAAPVELQKLEKPWGYRPQNQWRRVTVTGHYLVGNSVLVRNRPLDGNPGFLELVPFQLNDGTLVVVERGWIASDNDYNAPKIYALPSQNEQTIIAWVRPAEPDMGTAAPKGQLTSINIASLIRATGIKDRVYQHIYLRMQSESAAVAQTPTQLSKPALDEGNHLSYALQWILFAIMAVFALGWAIRKERMVRAGKQREKRKDADSTFEDSQLD